MYRLHFVNFEYLLIQQYFLWCLRETILCDKPSRKLQIEIVKVLNDATDTKKWMYFKSNSISNRWGLINYNQAANYSKFKYFHKVSMELS